MKAPKMKTRVLLFFNWGTGEGDYIDLPFGLVAGVARVLTGYDHNYIPVVQIEGNKFYFLSEKGELEPL